MSRYYVVIQESIVEVEGTINGDGNLKVGRCPEWFGLKGVIADNKDFFSTKDAAYIKVEKNILMTIADCDYKLKISTNNIDKSYYENTIEICKLHLPKVREMSPEFVVRL